MIIKLELTDFSPAFVTFKSTSAVRLCRASKRVEREIYIAIDTMEQKSLYIFIHNIVVVLYST